MASQEFNFTKKTIDAMTLLPENSKKNRQRYRDTGDKHLFLYITKKTKTFYYYRSWKGKPVEIKIGEFPEFDVIKARKKVTEYNNSFVNGIDPREAKKQEQIQEQQRKTLKQVFDLYIKHRKGKAEKTKAQDIQRFNSYAANLHNIKIEDISYSDIQFLFDNLKDKPYLANRIHELLRATFYYAINKLRIDMHNPCKGIEKNNEHARKRILNKAELNEYYHICNLWRTRSDKAMFSDIFLMLLYTGQRLTNVLEMKFNNIDFFNHIWKLQPTETKNNEYLEVPLIPEAMAILKNRKGKASCNYVFESPIISGQPIREIKWQWKIFLEETGISDLTRHDIRRTAGSIILMKTGNLKLVQQFLGHKDISTTAKVYAHVWQDKLKEEVSSAFKSFLTEPAKEPEKITG